MELKLNHNIKLDDGYKTKNLKPGSKFITHDAENGDIITTITDITIALTEDGQMNVLVDWQAVNYNTLERQKGQTPYLEFAPLVMRS